MDDPEYTPVSLVRLHPDGCFSVHSMEELQQALREALAWENYEDAAALRDEIRVVEAEMAKKKGMNTLAAATKP